LPIYPEILAFYYEEIARFPGCRKPAFTFFPGRAEKAEKS
jgi:hypothetical protein